jgi:hypothetical protein
MRRPAANNEIGILVYPESQPAAVLGLTDLYLEAGRICGEKIGNGALAVSRQPQSSRA